MTDKTTGIIRIFLATALMALAANCFLKYLWWTACYSAWTGIPKLAAQWNAAGVRASLNGWSVIILEAIAIVILSTLIRFRSSQLSGIFRTTLGLAIAFPITVAVTAIFALLLSWLKQGPA
jgi:hypothetical protein